MSEEITNKGIVGLFLLTLMIGAVFGTFITYAMVLRGDIYVPRSYEPSYNRMSGLSKNQMYAEFSSMNGSKDHIYAEFQAPPVIVSGSIHLVGNITVDFSKFNMTDQSSTFPVMMLGASRVEAHEIFVNYTTTKYANTNSTSIYIKFNGDIAIHWSQLQHYVRNGQSLSGTFGVTHVNEFEISFTIQNESIDSLIGNAVTFVGTGNA